MDRRTTLKKLLLGSSLSLLGGNLLANKPAEFKLRRVVLDAGHGGKDPGTVGKKSREKDVVLSLALQVGKYINENLPDVEAYLTFNDSLNNHQVFMTDGFKRRLGN